MPGIVIFIALFLVLGMVFAAGMMWMGVEVTEEQQRFWDEWEQEHPNWEEGFPAEDTD